MNISSEKWHIVGDDLGSVSNGYDYAQIIDDLTPLLSSDNDKRTRTNGIELTSFFIAQLKQRCHDDADIYSFPIMLRDPVVCNSEEKMLLIFERLNACEEKFTIHTKILDEIATRIFDDKLPTNIQRSYFHKFSSHILDSILLPAFHTNPAIDSEPTHYDGLIRTCRRLPAAFAAISRSIAERMQQHRHENDNLQAVLNRFIGDIRDDMRPSEFRTLYAERMRPLVRLLDNVSSSTDEKFVANVEEALLAVWSGGDAEQFVVLITHNPRWLYLWDQIHATK